MAADGWTQNYKPAQLGGPSNLHLDILEGRDTTIEWEDVFRGLLQFFMWASERVLICVIGNDNVFELPDFHTELEAKCRMNWQ